MGTKRTSRRRFLGIAGAAVAAPFIIPDTVWGANERINLASVGIGGMGNGDMGAMLGRTQVVAVCDVDSRHRQKAQERVNGHYKNQDCKAYIDFHEVMERTDIDAITCSTPDHIHAVVSIAAAKSGKDIYCQKPLSLTIREAREMVKAVRRYGRVFQTGSQQRSEYGGCFRQAAEYVRSGRLGELKTIHISIGGHSHPCNLPPQPTPEYMDWDKWLGPAQWRPYHEQLHPYKWRSFKEFSGGGMTDWGAHHFDIAQWALDMDESGPVEIYPAGTGGYQHLTYKYANGVLMYKDGQGPGVRFVGTKGRIDVHRGGITSEPASILKQPLGPNDVHLEKSPGHYENFVRCVRSRERPICDVEVGCRSVTVCHLGNIAYWVGRPIKWDPVKEEIVGDPYANNQVDRPMRPPYHL